MLPLLVTRGYGASSGSFGYLLAIGGGAATLTALVVGMLSPRRRPLASSYAMYVVGLAAVIGVGLAPDIRIGAVFVALLFVGATAGNIWQDSVLGSGSAPAAWPGELARLGRGRRQCAAVHHDLGGAGRSGWHPRDLVGAGVAAALASLLGLLLLLHSGEPRSWPSLPTTSPSPPKRGGSSGRRRRAGRRSPRRGR